jgi:hypothetical protein
MRALHASTITILVAAALLSPGSPRRADAQSRPAPIERVEAADAIPTAVGGARQSRARAGSRDATPVHVAFVDEETSWILPPAAPPETFETTGVLQCVPYARFMSGIGLRGDAWTWWDRAAGIYARGIQPEPGAVLSFPGIERMPLGHVAVVTQVLSARRILVDHANWPNAIVLHGAISRDVQVVDVSADNDWSEVRVQFGEGGPLGSVYPANGFIYEWNEAGVRIAQPRFSLDYALWSPGVASWRKFNSISYLWAFPPVERRKAYAAAGVVPAVAASGRDRPALVLGPIGPTLNEGALGRPLGVNRLDVRFGGQTGFGAGRLIMQ